MLNYKEAPHMQKSRHTLIHRLALGTAAAGLTLLGVGCASKKSETKIFDSRDTVPPPYHDPQSRHGAQRDWSQPADNAVGATYIRRDPPAAHETTVDTSVYGAPEPKVTARPKAKQPDIKLTPDPVEQEPARGPRTDQIAATRPAQAILAKSGPEPADAWSDTPDHDFGDDYVIKSDAGSRADGLKIGLSPEALPPAHDDLKIGGGNRLDGEPLTYQVRKGDSLWKIARLHGVTTSELAAANNMDKNDVLQIDRVLTIPAGGKVRGDLPVSAAAVSAAPSAPSSSSSVESVREAIPASGTYTVQKGDSLWKIGLRYNLRTSTIQGLNPHLSSTIQPGDTVYLTESAARAANLTPAKAASTTPDNSSRFQPSGAANAAPVSTGSSAPRTVPLRAVTAAADGAAAGSGKHIVVSGDNLWLLARKYNTTSDELARINNISKNDTLHIGDVILLPGSTPVAAATATVVNATPAATGAVGGTATPLTAVSPAGNPGAATGGTAGVQPAAARIRLPHFVEAGDTLEEIANMYGSKVEWILEANPDLKNGTALQDLQHVEVPVEDGGIGPSN